MAGEQWQSPLIHRRMNRRRLISAAGIGTAGLAVACSTRKGSGTGSSAGQAPSSPAAKQPKRGGTLNYAGGVLGSFDIQGRTFDPHIQTQSGSRSYTLFYERLVAYNLATYNVEPELAQKWEQPSPTEYLFHLQPNVKWQNKPPVNGRAMTTDDVLWSFQRAQTDDPKFYSRSLLTLVDRVEAPDQATIKVTTKSPDASTLKKLATDNLAVLSREVFEKFPKPSTAESAVGTGPFIMKSMEVNVGAEYVRNPDYWRPGQPYLDTFRSRNFPDAQTAYSAFLAGQIDVTLIDGATSKTFISQQGAGYTAPWAPDDTIGGLLYANVKAKPMDDARVVRALRLLIDHDEFVNAWAATQNGRGEIGSVFPAALRDWDLTQDEYRKLLEYKQPKDDATKEALSMLSAAGYNKDNPLKFQLVANNNPQGQQGLQLLQAQWKRFSGGIVDADVKLLEQSQVDAARANRSFQFGQFGTSAGPVDPEIWLGGVYHSGASLNFMNYSDPQLDAMIEKQRTILDETQRKAAVKQIVLYMADHSPVTAAANLYYLHATQKKVQGYVPETHYLNGRDFVNVWLDA
jgi:peptide/nickel transport system substrate-binding protein